MNMVKVKCKNCNREAPADQFKLHYKFKMMVCPDCFKGRTEKQQEAKKEEPPKPAGWDKEDEYLEKMVRFKKEETKVNFSPIPGSDFVQYSCFNCKYNFRYNPYKQIPPACPYCNTNIPKVKTQHLF